MNSALFAALLTIAAAPVVDVQAHLFIEPTEAGQAAAEEIAQSRCPHCRADIFFCRCAATANEMAEYEPSPYDGTYSEA